MAEPTDNGGSVNDRLIRLESLITSVVTDVAVIKTTQLNNDTSRRERKESRRNARGWAIALLAVVVSIPSGITAVKALEPSWFTPTHTVVVSNPQSRTGRGIP